MNIARGLLRLWIALSIAWIAVVAGVAWSEAGSAMRGRWQFSMELRDDVDPNAELAKGTPFNKVFRNPSEHRFPPGFSKLEYRYQRSWDEDVAKGQMVLTDFPDGSALYINTAFDKSERDLVGRRFWDTRWSRRWELLTEQTWMIPVALGPPLAVLLIGFVVRWILRGFRAG